MSRHGSKPTKLDRKLANLRAELSSLKKNGKSDRDIVDGSEEHDDLKARLAMLVQEQKDKRPVARVNAHTTAVVHASEERLSRDIKEVHDVLRGKETGLQDGQTDKERLKQIRLLKRTLDNEVSDIKERESGRLAKIRKVPTGSSASGTPSSSSGSAAMAVDLPDPEGNGIQELTADLPHNQAAPRKSQRKRRHTQSPAIPPTALAPGHAGSSPDASPGVPDDVTRCGHMVGRSLIDPRKCGRLIIHQFTTDGIPMRSCRYKTHAIRDEVVNCTSEEVPVPVMLVAAPVAEVHHSIAQPEATPIDSEGSNVEGPVEEPVEKVAPATPEPTGHSESSNVEDPVEKPVEKAAPATTIDSESSSDEYSSSCDEDPVEKPVEEAAPVPASPLAVSGVIEEATAEVVPAFDLELSMRKRWGPNLYHSKIQGLSQVEPPITEAEWIALNERFVGGGDCEFRCFGMIVDSIVKYGNYGWNTSATRHCRVTHHLYAA